MTDADKVAGFATYLYEQGFNVVCVSGDKKPLGSWDASKRSDKPPRCKEAVAITGNFFADEQYKVAIFDVDNPQTKILEEAFGPDWRKQLCGQPWSFCVLTGPRPKHLVECEGEDCAIFEDKEHTKAVKHVKLSELERGFAVVVRVPSNCIKGNLGTMRNPDVEIIYSNYQVVYGRHPSGVFYQPVKWENEKWVPVDAPGAGVVLSCEEFFRVVGLIKGADKKGEEKDEEGKAIEPPKSWDRDIAKPDVLLALLKRWWPLMKDDGGHFHDALTFGIASLAWRYGVKKETIMDVFDKLFKWAIEQGLDTERDVAHHKSVVDWVYSADKDRKRWGGRKLREVLADVLRAEKNGTEPTELEVEEVFSTIFEAFGLKERRPEDVVHGVLCVPLKWVTDGQGNAIAAEWLCNTKGGIIVRRFKKNKKKRKKGEGGSEDEGGEEEGEEKSLFEDIVLVDMSISSLTVYSDVLTGREYVSADTLIGTTGLARWRMKPRNNFVREVEELVLVRTSPRWRALLNYYPHVPDVIISGFFCPNPDDPHLGKLTCGVRDYFHTGIRDSDKPTARAALETTLSVLNKYAPDDKWYETAVTALVHDLAQVFVLTRKVWGVRPSFVVLEGPRGLGKSTIGQLALHALFPERADDLFVSASGAMTAARLGRLLDELAAGVVVLDEQKGVLHRPEVMEVLKSMITSTVAWKTAWGEKWPAAAGLVLTANKFVVTDPEVADKLYKIQFSGVVDQSKRPEFAAAMSKVFNIVGDFGGYYLHYAERNWAAVKDVILAPTQAEAAEKYAKVIADELGVTIELVPVADLTAVPAAVTAIDIFRDLVWRELKQQMAAIRDNADAISAKQAFNILFDKGRIPFMRRYNGDETKYMILKNIELYNNELSLRSLCDELGGELYTKSRNKLYYGACIVDEAKVQDVLFPDDAPEEEGQ